MFQPTSTLPSFTFGQFAVARKPIINGGAVRPIGLLFRIAFDRITVRCCGISCQSPAVRTPLFLRHKHSCVCVWGGGGGIHFSCTNWGSLSQLGHHEFWQNSWHSSSFMDGKIALYLTVNISGQVHSGSFLVLWSSNASWITGPSTFLRTTINNGHIQNAIQTNT